MQSIFKILREIPHGFHHSELSRLHFRKRVKVLCLVWLRRVEEFDEGGFLLANEVLLPFLSLSWLSPCIRRQIKTDGWWIRFGSKLK
jgi:hypothetical protein